MVQLSDYQFTPQAGALDGQAMFGAQTSAQELDNLNKALSAGSTTGRETTGSLTASGAPLKVESLDKTLKNITFGHDYIAFWKNIPKAAAYNTVEEYNQLVSYGQNRGGFYSEGETPQIEDSIYRRQSQLIKFMGVQKSITHPMTLVNTNVGDIMKQEIENATLWILRKLDTSLYIGDETFIPDEFNGLFTQHANNADFTSLDAYFNSEIVVDCRGSKLTESFLEDACNGLIQNFGIGSVLYATPRTLSDFQKSFYNFKFITPGSGAQSNGTAGQNMTDFQSPFGKIQLAWDFFLNPAPTKLSTSQATSTLAPGAPVADGSAPSAAVATDASSKFNTTDSSSGNYWYAVSAMNKYGESVLTVLGGAAVTVPSGGAADLKFTAGSGTTTGYTIYRSNKGAASAAAATFFPVLYINPTKLTAGYDGAAAGLVRDRYRFINDGHQAMLIENNQQVLNFKQLAPLMKMDLAITGPSFQFLTLLYGSPFLYAQRKMIRFVNIGRN